MKVITEKGGVKARSVNDRAIEHSISQKTELSKKNERELRSWVFLFQTVPIIQRKKITPMPMTAV
ncbi:MAG: hypothetical protein ACI4J8_04405 [Oscillospiraceae bacterium]